SPDFGRSGHLRRNTFLDQLQFATQTTFLHDQSAKVQNDPVSARAQGRAMTASLDWDDLRYFLAVARGGSTLGAGRALRVSQTTVARRVAAFEERLGLVLFERRQAGYALTPAGEALVPEAEAMEHAAAAFAEAAGAQARD